MQRFSHFKELSRSLLYNLPPNTRNSLKTPKNGICRLFTAAFTLAGCPRTCTHACCLRLSCLLAAICLLLASRHLSASLAACGAKVRHENHSDKLLCENFTMKRIFRPKAAQYRVKVAPACNNTGPAAWTCNTQGGRHGIPAKQDRAATVFLPRKTSLPHYTPCATQQARNASTLRTSCTRFNKH